MTAPDSHPTRDELAGFAAGRVEEAALEAIQAHLAECPACRAVLASLPADDLEQLLRVPSVGDSTTKPTDPPSERSFLADHPRYRLLGKIGQGGMGTVYRAEHRLMKRAVALKVIHSRIAAQPAAVARFRREVEAVARLAHPNIAAAFDAEEIDGNIVLATEFVGGSDLGRLVRESGPLSVGEACDIARQIALALCHAHENGMTHRDIKPANVMRTPAGQVKVLDFGLALATEDAGATGGLTDLGDGLGTPDFIAPEQVRDAHCADARSDIYSLGCTLYFLLTGKPPFDAAKTPFAKVAAHLEQPAQPVSVHRGDIPAEVERILRRTLAKNPKARFQTATEVVAALAEIPVTPSAPRSRRGGRRWFGLVAVLVVGVVSVGAFLAVRLPGTVEPAGEVRVLLGHTEPVRYTVFSPDGKMVLTAGVDRTMRLWDVATGKEIRRYQGPGGAFLSCAFSPDGEYVVGGNSDSTACLWRIENDGAEDRCFRGHTHSVHQVSFSRDGRRLLTAGLDGTVRVWDVDSGAVERQYHVGSPVNSAAWSPDERTILTGSNDKILRLFDADTTQEVRRLLGHTDQVLNLCFSPDGSRALSAGHDATMRLWDVRTGEQLQVHQATTNFACVAFSPDGRRALVGGWDRIVRVWDVERWEEVATLAGHTGRVSCVCFSPDGRLALTSGQDNTARLWRLPQP